MGKQDNITVDFPPLSGGEEVGFNDAGIEQFQRDQVDSLVRECTQNSTDAPADNNSKVRVEFHLLDLDVGKLGFMPALTSHLEECHRYVSEPSRRDKESKAVSFFGKALGIAKRQKIRCLLVRDFNTTGLTGDDADGSGKWHTLVKTRGSSNKNSTASGGSFGIGKNAPFACSGLRTVIYATRTNKGTAWQGKSMLITHLDPDRENKTQGVGFIGRKDGENYLSVRDGSLPCPEMCRQENELGTDILILGFNDETWMDKLIGSAVKHFWPSLEKDMVVFRAVDHTDGNALKERELNKDNLDAHTGWLIESEPVEIESFNPLYLNVYRTEPSIIDVKHLGPCKFHLHVGGGIKHTREVCCFRNNKMVIEHMNIKQGGNFTAVFECDSEQGSSLLKNMEPPRHDKWDKGQPQENQRIYAELYKDMRDKMRAVIDSRLNELIKDTTDPDDINLGTEDGDAKGQQSLAPKSLIEKAKFTRVSLPASRKRPSKPGTLKPKKPGETQDPKTTAGTNGNVAKGVRVIGSNLRCLLTKREADHCEYKIQLPPKVCAGTAIITVEALGFDGGNMNIDVKEPQGGAIVLKGGETSIIIKVDGAAMALQANLALNPNK